MFWFWGFTIYAFGFAFIVLMFSFEYRSLSGSLDCLEMWWWLGVCYVFTSGFVSFHWVLLGLFDFVLWVILWLLS